jgi:thiamine pyrophosphokinase
MQKISYFVRNDTVILADGSFPQHEIPLNILRNAVRIVCCDGAAGSLIKFGLIPYAILGDCDSIDPEIFDKYADRIFKDTEQETNDLTKAVKWCFEKGYKDIIILGATGKREDHSIGNISLLADYARFINVKMITDTGIFYPVLKSSRLDSFPGQQISVFSISTETEITSTGLLYPLNKRRLKSWWEATLNEAVGDSFELKFEKGKVIVFMEF